MVMSITHSLQSVNKLGKLMSLEIKMKPVKNLSLKMQLGGEALLASWLHEDDDHLNLCYFYRASKILESQKREVVIWVL